MVELGAGTMCSSSISAATPIMRCGARESRLFARRVPGSELEHRIGPIDMPIDRILARKHALCESLADDHDRLVILVIERVEIAPGKNGNAEAR